MWKDIPGFEGLYQISSVSGRVRSLSRVVNCNPRGRGVSRRMSPGKILKGGLSGKYHRVVLCKGGKHYRRSVHHLVLTTFIGPRPEGMCGLHKDDNPSNNALPNLYWGTPRENSLDAVRNRRYSSVGERNPRAKLTEDDVLKLRELRSSGSTMRSLQLQFGLNLATVYRIVNRVTWKHV